MRSGIIALIAMIMLVVAGALVGCTTATAPAPTPTVSRTWQEFARAMDNYYGMPLSHTQEARLTTIQLQQLGLTIRSSWDYYLQRQLSSFRDNGIDPMTVGPLCYVLQRFMEAYNVMFDAQNLGNFVAAERELRYTAAEITAILVDINPEYGPWPPRGTFHISVPLAERPPAERFVEAGLFKSRSARLGEYSTGT